MRLSFVALLCISAGSLGIATAEEPPAATGTPVPGTTAAQVPAAPPASNATPATPAAAAAAPAAKQDVKADANEKHLLAEGYKSEMRNGDKVFCRKEELLGSRLGGKKVCDTADNLVAREDMDKANAERTERQGRSGVIPGGH
jgi:hypothetical protein